MRLTRDQSQFIEILQSNSILRLGNGINTHFLFPFYSQPLCKARSFLVIQAEVLWPSGTYGLPEAVTGCPEFGGQAWQRGFTYHDTADVEPSNKRSANYHFAGNFSQHGIEQRFCIKDKPEGGSEFWPEGKYCIYKKGKLFC